MQKWQYAVCFLDTGGTTPMFGYNPVRPRWFNGQELRDWKKIDLTSFLNQLGDDGWELVSTSYEPPRQLLILKQVKP